jgi:hypothetical protein
MKGFCLGLFLFCSNLAGVAVMAQRTYVANSVLATGNWYRIAVRQEGIYRIDPALLGSLGIPANPASAAIRLWGTSGGMLPENSSTPRTDDLAEIPLDMNDGGDGVFNGSDYCLFYARGPHEWVPDSANQRFTHRKNLYTDTVYYYLTVGGTGKRISQQTGTRNATVNVSDYQDRFFYENDLVNLLSSGKEWLGEEFNTNPGGTGNRNFPIDWPGLITSEPVTLITSLAARSVGAGSRFSVSLNGQKVQEPALPGVSGYFLDPFATLVSQTVNATVTQNPLTVNLAFTPGTGTAQGWLNWFELFGRRSLTLGSNQLLFRDWKSVSSGAVAGFTISNTGTGIQVWDITDPLEPQRMSLTITGTQARFTNTASRLREYLAFLPGMGLTPIAAGTVPNQNLHAAPSPDLLLITHVSLLQEATRLARFHEQQDGYTTLVVTTDQVYREFSGGVPDPSAIRDFAKMLYDRPGTGRRLRYLLLFGSGSFDYRNRISNNRNLVPAFESVNSLDPLLTYTSDDFFGLLSDSTDINLNNQRSLMQIGIGRIPTRNTEEAGIMVDKIIRYQQKPSLGAWRNQLVFVADDQDQNLHLQDAESLVGGVASVNPLFNPYKIYLDAYPLVSNSAGNRYPSVNDAIVSQVFKGALLVNYSGHGSSQRLADEAVLTADELNRFNNADRLPLFITASCDFAPHDDPSKNSLGAGILTGNRNGAIALLTTTRLVFAYSNRIINENYLKAAFTTDASGEYLTLGESVRQAKNNTLQATGDLLNNRKFTLLGDPAMRLAFPRNRVQLTGINGHVITTADTLRALGAYTIAGRIINGNGQPVTDFNGTVEATVYDRVQTLKTLGNDPASIVTGFQQQTGVLYKGRATVRNGNFEFSFVMPKDISFQGGYSRISLYATDSVRDANGVDTRLYISGFAQAGAVDQTGPGIKVWLNDTLFMNGGLTNENPVLLARLSDPSGINTSGNSIGHDITVVIDGDERNLMVLNDYYTAAVDDFTRGEIRFQLPAIAEGRHSLRLKAWDVANNSSAVQLDFVVAKKEKLVIQQLMNYPNPLQQQTRFSFEHNQPYTDMDVTVQIYNLSGGLVKTIHQVVNTGGSRNAEITWNGDNQSGAKLAKGYYIYKVIVKTGTGQATATRQLVLF